MVLIVIVCNVFYVCVLLIVPDIFFFFFFQAEDGIRDAQESRGLGDVYKRQVPHQILSFVGQRMKWDVLEADLRGLLLTDAEMAVFDQQMEVTEEEAVPLEEWLVDVPFAAWEADGEEDDDDDDVDADAVENVDG
eukprot:TRINITY_DN5392_c0_g1_i2.p1 TRINITY_DN5392_c0_g1~~TRINITY_DN5392_c0_g1_i2.p1  ORF type:complete len:135 (-),score=55.18 TRINITY_DN5392_c0_g1_i2:96-500(-)